MALMAKVTVLLALTILHAFAASFPPVLHGVELFNSTRFPGRSISYKETFICETTKGVKSYSGYVNLPPDPSSGRAYEAHIYFWFFEARKNAQNAPLSLWLQGGPGVPSITAALGENGPCSVNDDSKSTTLNPWSWNDRVNMLYIDQPVQVGFSYNMLVNGTLDELPTPFLYKPQDFTATGIPETNLTFLTGTFATPDRAAAPNTTVAAAPVIWDFMQTWMQEFPAYKQSSNKFSIWGESYAGHYAPTYSNYFETQNDLIAAGIVTPPAIPLHIETIGLINACIDIDTQISSYPKFAFNNTYGIKAINETQYQIAIGSLGTCLNMTGTCRRMADEQDPRGLGNNPAVNKACLDAFLYCFDKMHSGYDATKHNLFDVTAPQLESFPTKWPAGYLNTAEIQQALGVPLNWTGNSAVVSSGFNLTGDFVRGRGLKYLGRLLDRGVKVALVYGDRDYNCNWLGGEQVSLSVRTNGNANLDFARAGYADIVTNSSYVGGLVRQHGNLSFSRVFQAGHEVPYYQPETAYQIFNRVMFDADVATGQKAASGYSSKGLGSAFTRSERPPKHEEPRCYLWDIFETCTEEQKSVLRNGTAVVENFILVGYKSLNGEAVYYDGAKRGQGSSPGSRSSAARNVVNSGNSGMVLPVIFLLMGVGSLLF